MTSTDPSTLIDVPVLIVGGGPVGLTTSILLSRLGIESLLVERHPGTAVLPKARALNPRTMEMYRQIGIEDEIRAAGMDPKFGRMVLWAESLAGREIHRLQPGRQSRDQDRASAIPNCGCAQDLLEPILRRHAEAAGPGQLRFDTSMQSLQFGSEEANGELVDRKSGVTCQFRATYVVAADGAQSSIRRQLGVTMAGERDVYDSVNIHFQADLTPWTADRPAALYFIEQPDLRGTFLTINGSDRWSFLVTSVSLYGYRPEQFDVAFCADVIRKAVGVEELAIQVLGVGAWKASAIVADRYRDGPVFLVGDAAHEMPPTGGLGLNTGVQDAQNLAWKLAAVLKNGAGDGLLDTYDAERRPVGELTSRTSLLNALSMGRAERQSNPVLPRGEFLNERGLVFGIKYRSSAVIEAESPAPFAHESVTDYVPCAMPGHRAPHVWLDQEGRKVSVLDILGESFVVLAGPRGGAWARAAAEASEPPIRAFVIGTDLHDSEGEWAQTYAAGPESAVLIRPDGMVAWRAEHLAEDPAGSLMAALNTILNRARIGPSDSPGIGHGVGATDARRSEQGGAGRPAHLRQQRST